MSIVMKLENVTLEYPVARRYRKENVKPSGIRNVSFELEEGDVLGIIGRNGSGKSTLLKMMAGVFPPNDGIISSRGAVSLLAGVGVGFNKELTGRENAYLYGALMGRSRKQIDELIDEIQSFAELTHHFDRPFRTFSSGMRARLGISVATAFRPDLLLIDEVLGVGDVSFREKSQKRVRELIETSGSVIIVSHSLGMLKEMCTRMILIEDGEVIMDDEPGAVIAKYAEILKV